MQGLRIGWNSCKAGEGVTVRGGVNAGVEHRLEQLQGRVEGVMGDK